MLKTLAKKLHFGKQLILEVIDFGMIIVKELSKISLKLINKFI